jgi:RNA polymerase sigma factor (sigma-70 family)
MKYADRYDPARPLGPWLTAILRRKVEDARRRTARSPDPFRVRPPLALGSPVHEAERVEREEEVRRVLGGLPEPYRSVGMLRWRFGLEPAEIAEIRGEPPGTVRSILSRALARLRREIQGLPVLLLGGRSHRGLATVRREALGAAGGAAAPAVPALLLGACLLGGTLMAKKSIVAAGAVALAALGGWLALLGEEGSPAPGAGVASGPSRSAAAPRDSSAPAAPSTSPAPLGDGVLLGRLVRGAPPRPVEGSVTVSGPGIPARSLAAGPDGRFRASGLPRESVLSLEAASPGLVPSRRHGLRVPRQGDLDVGDVVLGAGSRLEVLVRDATDAPVAGARVSLHGTAGGWQNPLEIPALPPPEARATSDGSGRALLEGVAPGSWNVLAAAAGFAERSVRAEVVEGEVRDPVRVVLVPGHALEGRVLGPDGSPLPGAAVAAWWGRSESGWTLDRVETAADALGRYRLEGLAAGTWRLRVRKGPDADRGGGVVEVPDVAVYDIRLSGGATLRGTVVDADGGGPLAGAAVLLKVFGPDWSWAAHVRAASAADGSFLAEDLPPGTIFGIEATLPGYFLAANRDELRVELRSGGVEEKVVKLRRGSAIAGIVRDENGAPVPCARVSCGSAAFWSPLVTAGADGAYRISPVAPGRTLLFAVAEGRHLPGYPVPPWQAIQSGNLPPEISVDVPASGEVRKDLVLRPAGAVEGLVVDGAGRPVAGARVALAVPSSHVPGAVVSGADGAFRFESLSPGDAIVLEATGTRGARGASEALRVAEGETVRGVRIALAAGASLSGTVRCADGGPARGVVLRLVTGSVDLSKPWQQNEWQIRNAATVPVAADGAFHAAGLAPGTYTLLAEAEGCAFLAGKPFPLAGAESRDGLEMVLSPEEALAGRVVAEDGAPLAGALLSAVSRPLGERVYYAGDGFQAMAVADGAGRFEIRGLSAGNHVLTARAPGFLDGTLEVAAGTRDIVLRLGHGLSISGTVVDRVTGEPVAGVRVSSQSVDPSPRFMNNVQAVSAADGTFTLAALAPGAYMVWTYGGEFTSTQRNRVEAGSRDLRIAVERGLSVSGRVVDALDRPVEAGGNIAAMGVGADGKPDWARQGMATVGEGGVFRVGGLSAGAYDLVLNPRYGGRSGPQAILRDVTAGSEGVVLRVPAGEPIRGRVVDEDGKPPESGGMLSVIPQGSTSRDMEGAWAGITPDGTFTTPPLDAARTYDLSVEQVPGRLPAALRGIAPGARDVVLRLRRARTITGRVVDEQGRPAPEGVPVAARAPDLAAEEPGARSSTATRPDGTFTLETLADAAFRVTVGGRNSDLLPAEQDVLAGATGVEIRAARGLALSGRLLDPEGRPVPAAKLTVTEGPTAARGRWTRTAADGTFALRGLPPGAVVLQAAIEERTADLGSLEPPAAGLELRLPSR